MSDDSTPTGETKRSADAEEGATSGDRATRRADRKQGRKEATAKVKKGTDVLRSRLASLVWLVAVVFALFLAIGALLVALDAVNQENPIVRFILAVAERLDLLLSPDNGVFQSKDSDREAAVTKNHLVNWGLAAVAYLVAGKILDRLIRP